MYLSSNKVNKTTIFNCQLNLVLLYKSTIISSGPPRLCAHGHRAAPEGIQTHCHQCEGILLTYLNLYFNEI